MHFKELPGNKLTKFVVGFLPLCQAKNAALHSRASIAFRKAEIFNNAERQKER